MAESYIDMARKKAYAGIEWVCIEGAYEVSNKASAKKNWFNFSFGMGALFNISRDRF